VAGGNPPSPLEAPSQEILWGSYDNCLSCANSALSFMCRTNLGSYFLWPMRLRNCFLGAYKSVSSFWDRVPFSRRPSYEHAGSSCLLHINLRSRPMSLSIDGSLTRIHNHVKTNAISAAIFSMRPHLCNMITPTGICRRPGVSHKLF
jgi:hypothetical protein